MIIKNMKKLPAFISCVMLALAQQTMAQEQVPVDSNYVFSGYIEQLEQFRQMPALPGAIVFLGNSLTDAGRWNDIIPHLPVINRGISGDISFGVLARLDEVLRHQPKKIFLMIGVNDLKREVPVALIIKNYARIVERIKKESPKTTIYLNSIMPINEAKLLASFKLVKNADIIQLNKGLKALSLSQKGIKYIDLYPLVADSSGQLREEITPDGIHLEVSAYVAFVDYLKKIKAL